PPKPITTATYCLPSTLYVIGAELGTSLSRTLHSALPFAASYAVNHRSSAPANTTPPAVASTPVVCGARWRCTHTVLRVSRLIASKRPYRPSLSNLGRSAQRTPLDSTPRSPSPTGVMSMHDSTSGTYRTCVPASYEPGSQFFAPPACGQTVILPARLGINFGSTVFAPVLGSIAVMRFCSPRSIENT